MSTNGATIRFGIGNYGVDIGTLGGEPCVFIIPNEKPGPVGERIPLSEQGLLELDRLPDEWTVLLFPTRERCKEVADALVGSKMDKWSDDGVTPAPCGGRVGSTVDLPLIGESARDQGEVRAFMWFDHECRAEGCQSLVWKDRYEAAVKGRSDFRNAYKAERNKVAALETRLAAVKHPRQIAG